MTTTLSSDAIGLTRRRLLDHGSVTGELIGDALAASWQRSMAAGLDPASTIAEFPRASTVQLAEARERQRNLIDHAMPTLAYLHSQTRDTGSVIVLSDAQGLLLQSCGDPEFVDRAARVNLAPGASWNETLRGTNAVGTSLAMREPTVVTGGEHFLACNGFLTCAAAPISDSLGELLGVLDISGDHRSCHPHTFGLVRAAAQMIETGCSCRATAATSVCAFIRWRRGSAPSPRALSRSATMAGLSAPIPRRWCCFRSPPPNCAG